MTWPSACDCGTTTKTTLEVAAKETMNATERSGRVCYLIGKNQPSHSTAWCS